MLGCPGESLRRKKTTDDIPRRMLILLLELLKSGELPELAVGGAWACISDIMIRGSAALCTAALESDICGLAVVQLQAMGPVADRVVSPCAPFVLDCL
jgi:hypothetical protein